MAVNYKELDDALGMMGAPKDTRPMPKTKPIPLVKPKPIKTSSKKKPEELDLSMLDKLPKKAAEGGLMKKKGYAKGGMMKKGYKKGGKVRGAGKATKGVRAAKMVTMKGS